MRRNWVGICLVFAAAAGLCLVWGAGQMSASPGDASVVSTDKADVSSSADPVPSISPCPSGWKLESGNKNGKYVCVPKTPKPGKCAPEFEWYSTKCECGCRIPPPK